METYELKKILTEIAKDVFKDDIDAIRNYKTILHREYNYRTNIVKRISGPEWKLHCESKHAESKATLDNLDNTGSYSDLLIFRNKPITSEFVQKCINADIDEWVVINHILCEIILNEKIKKGSLAKIRCLNNYRPHNTVCKTFKCTNCGTSYTINYSTKTTPSIYKSNCVNCELRPSYLPHILKISVKNEHLLNKLDNIKERALSHPLIKNYSVEQASEAEEYYLFCTNHNKIPVETIRYLNDLKSKTSTLGKMLLSENELPTYIDKKIQETIFTTLINIGVINTTRKINISKTIANFINSIGFRLSYINNSTHEYYNNWVRQNNYYSNQLIGIDIKLDTIIINEIYDRDIVYEHEYKINKFFMEAEIEIDAEIETDAKQIKPIPTPIILENRNVFVISTSSNSNGFIDFIETLKLNQSSIKSFLGNASKSNNGLKQALEKLDIRENDILVIIRGGGDTKHETFNAFNSESAKIAIESLVAKGVTVVTGIGHAKDHFEIDRAATYAEITPTQAAIRVNSLIN